jgi:hypothetical protein
MSTPVTVFALRRDGFTNTIELELTDAPSGFSLSGAKISAGQDQAQFTLKAPPEATEKPVVITIAGHAVIGGKRIEHAAAPAEDMMQAFFYRHLVPSKELAVTVNGQQRAFVRDSFKIISATPVKILPGGTARVRVSVPSSAFADRFKLELDQAPAGMSLESVSPVAGGLELVFACDAEKMKAGTAGNLICAVVPKNPSAPDPQKKSLAMQPKRAIAATLPAIPFTVVNGG